MKFWIEINLHVFPQGTEGQMSINCMPETCTCKMSTLLRIGREKCLTQ